MPVPSYLIALAVGDLRFKEIGPRTGVYAEQSMLSAAAEEFADTERLLQAGEKLFGPYRWDRLRHLGDAAEFSGRRHGESAAGLRLARRVIAGDKSLDSRHRRRIWRIPGRGIW